MIRTKRLRLIPATVELLHAELRGRRELEHLLGIPVPESWGPELYDRSVVEYRVSKLTVDPKQHGWWGYYVVLDSENGGRPVVVGTAGFKGLPSPEGTAEVGYGVLPEYRRRGIAMEATLGLVAHAFTHGNVERVIAETLAENVPSIGVLQKCGFQLRGEGSEAGVIRYELTREDFDSIRNVP